MTPTVPVKVEYALTGDGQRLVPVVNVMQQFSLWLKARPEAAAEERLR